MNSIQQSSNDTTQSPADVLKTFIAAYREELTKLGMNRNSIATLTRFIGYIEETGIDFRILRPKDAELFQTYLSTNTTEKNGTPYSRGYIQTIVSNTRSFYDYLIKKKIIASNPFAEVRRIRQRKTLPRNILSEADMEKLLKRLADFNRGSDVYARRQQYKAHVAAEMMYSTGCRVSEIVGLKITDVDIQRGVVLVRDSKAGRFREAIVNSYAQKTLEIYLSVRKDLFSDPKSFPSDNDLLFGSSQSMGKYLNRTVAAECVNLELGRFTSHGFRHAVGFHLLRNGCDIRYIQDILGHRKLYSTQIYTKVDRIDLKNMLDGCHPRKLHDSSGNCVSNTDVLKQRVLSS